MILALLPGCCEAVCWYGDAVRDDVRLAIRGLSTAYLLWRSGLDPTGE